MFTTDTQKTQIRDLAEEIVLTEEKIKQLEKGVIARKKALISLLQQSGQTGVLLDSGLFPRLETKQRIGKRKEIEAGGDTDKYLRGRAVQNKIGFGA